MHTSLCPCTEREGLRMDLMEGVVLEGPCVGGQGYSGKKNGVRPEPESTHNMKSLPSDLVQPHLPPWYLEPCAACMIAVLQCSQRAFVFFCFSVLLGLSHVR